MSKDTQHKNSIIVLGASPNPNRTSYLASKILMQKGYEVHAYGKRSGQIDQLSIQNEIPQSATGPIDAITIFLKPDLQKEYYNYILSTNPRSIIFNPGTENPELEKLAAQQKINIISCCTIALSAVGMI